MLGLHLGGGPWGGGLAFLGLGFFLLNILSFHSAMPRNAVFPESGHNFRTKRSLAFLGSSLALSGSAFCARKMVFAKTTIMQIRSLVVPW